jgi:hypothetical protein
MHGLFKATPPRRQRKSSRRHFRHGLRAAAVRAFTAASLHLHKSPLVSALASAAECTGSNVSYVRAATVLLKANNTSLIGEVMAGRIPLLQAASQVRHLVNLVEAYRAASPEARAAAGRTVGIDAVWDEMIVPGVTDDHALVD